MGRPSASWVDDLRKITGGGWTGTAGKFPHQTPIVDCETLNRSELIEKKRIFFADIYSPAYADFFFFFAVFNSNLKFYEKVRFDEASKFSLKILNTGCNPYGPLGGSSSCS